MSNLLRWEGVKNGDHEIEGVEMGGGLLKQSEGAQWR